LSFIAGNTLLNQVKTPKLSRKCGLYAAKNKKKQSGRATYLKIIYFSTL